LRELASKSILDAGFRFSFKEIVIYFILLRSPANPFIVCFLDQFLHIRQQGSSIFLRGEGMLRHDLGSLKPIINFINHYFFTIWTELIYGRFVAFAA